MKTTPRISPHHQTWSHLLHSLLSRINQIQDKVEGALETISDSPEEVLMFMIYDWKFPHLKNTNPKKQTYARDEWCIQVADLHARAPYHMSNLIENFYNNEKVRYWSNNHHLSFYYFTGEYLGRKFSIMFYDSPEKKTGKKIPFQEFLANNSNVRICWY